MSRKHYVMVAAQISAELADHDHLGETPRWAGKRATASLARRLADQFKADNANFRYDTFYAACGLDEWGNVTS